MEPTAEEILHTMHPTNMVEQEEGVSMEERVEKIISRLHPIADAEEGEGMEVPV